MSIVSNSHQCKVRAPRQHGGSIGFINNHQPEISGLEGKSKSTFEVNILRRASNFEVNILCHGHRYLMNYMVCEIKAFN